MDEQSEQPAVTVDAATPQTPRLPAIGKNEGLSPLHLSQYAIEQNVARIAIQIAEGREPTYD